MNSDRSKEVLEKHMGQAMENLSSFLDTNGMHISILTEAMNTFIQSLFDLPGEAACKSGCAYCCHLRVGASIPEVLILFNGLKTCTGKQELSILEERVNLAVQKGNVTDDVFWRKTRTACLFLETEAQDLCLIYLLRPFSCRAFHSTDKTVCRRGFEEGKKIQIPCFPLYRASTDMYSTVFIRVMAQKGLYSYQVELVRALQILFKDDRATDLWLKGEDVFKAAKIS